MNYAELTANIEDICENTFSADQLAMFTQQAEQKIYNSVQIPALRKNVVGTLTATVAYAYLINKDVNFIREAYPTPTATGMPVHYAFFADGSFLVGPTPDSSYSTELHYGYYPESIVTAGTTWLGDEFDSALLNGALVEALRFMKGEADIVALYDKMYVQAVSLLKNLGDGKLREDTYRSGQLKIKVG
jgi:hypothetical protein